MSIKLLYGNRWLVQVQRCGMRKTMRGKGGKIEAKLAEKELLKELEDELAIGRAKELLGAENLSNINGSNAHAPERKPEMKPPTLREYYHGRWQEHIRVVQNEITRKRNVHPFNYLLHYIGHLTIDECLKPKTVNYFIEQMKADGPLSFRNRKDGKPRKLRVDELSNTTINKSLQNLKAMLNLAFAEAVIDKRPRIDLLPQDDATPVLPPTGEEFARLLEVCQHYREVAPLLREVVELAADTGLRRGELFSLRWASIEMDRRAIRVEMQRRGRMVNGVCWKPKHGKFREIPMSDRVVEILENLQQRTPNAPGDLVIPSRGGAPYCPMDTADRKGKGYFPDAVKDARLKGKVTFHGLRHYFAVRLLTRGAPITVVSELLGHSDINLTVKRYGRFSSDAEVKREAVQMLSHNSGQFCPMHRPDASIHR